MHDGQRHFKIVSSLAINLLYFATDQECTFFLNFLFLFFFEIIKNRSTQKRTRLPVIYTYMCV